jgi:phosphatidylglycerophosphatase A
MNPGLPQLLRNPVHLLAFGFGSGLASRAPGTFGTLAAVPLYLVLSQWPPLVYLTAVALACLAGVVICGRTAQDLGVHDHPGIVWDEIAGYLLTMAFAPRHWGWMLLGILFFRLFDIWKPWPIGLIDRRFSGGLGIMLDDLVAGLFAAGALALVGLFWGGA